MQDHTVLVVNPRSGLGQTGRRWNDMEAVIRRELPEFEVRMTEGAGHATVLTREALQEGASLVVAVGGDGTNNEVINGFLDEEVQPTQTECAFGFISAGTGSDLERTFGKRKSLRASARAIADATPRPIDVGRVTFMDHDGQERRRAFVNIASFGASGLVVKSVNSQRLAGGSLAYAWCSAKAIMRYRTVPVEIRIDDLVEERPEFTLCTVANGQYFGGGMHVSPHADPSDGQFDVVQVWGWRSLRLLLQFSKIYSGSHIAMQGVSEGRGRRVEARPLDGDEVLIDVDGEQPGRLPAAFEILPSAVQARV